MAYVHRWCNQKYHTSIISLLTIFVSLFVAACGVSGTVPKPTQRDFGGILQFGGTSRSYNVHLPPDYDGIRSYPLVLAFHGAGQNSLTMTALSQLNVTADRSGFIVVYPNALAGLWSFSLGDGKDDVSYTIALLDDLNRNLKISSGRIYAVGLSEGGFFAEFLACQRANRITAVGTVGATLEVTESNTCITSRPLSVILFNGDKDPIVPYTGGISNRLTYL